MLASMREADERAEAPAGWVFHDLRRTSASGMAGLGIPPHVVEAVLNHRSGTIRGVAAVYNRYTYAAEKRAALDRVGGAPSADRRGGRLMARPSRWREMSIREWLAEQQWLPAALARLAEPRGRKTMASILRVTAETKFQDE